MADIKGLLFDMDGLLLDTEVVGRQAFIKATGAYGLPESEAFAAFPRFIGGNSASARPMLRQLLPNVDSDLIDHEWGVAFEALLEEGVPVKATVHETLEGLVKRGLPMAVVTSTSGKKAQHHLTRAGLGQYFSVLVAGDEVANRKPHPEPYETGASKLGYETHECAAFEDSDLGTASAVAAGCITTQIPDIRVEGLPLPDLGQRQASTLRDAVEQLGLL